MIVQKACTYIVFLWFSTSIVLVPCEGRPKFIGNIEKKYHVDIGSSVKLRCPVTGTKDPLNNRTLVAWEYGDVFIANSLQRWPRFHVIPGKYLKIVNVNKQDAGVYTCSAYNQFGTIKINITLLIRRGEDGKGRPPEFKRNARKEMSFKTGETAKLKCHSTGNPDPHIRWFKDGHSYGQHKRTSVSPSGWILNLRYLSVDDSGKYSCCVSNTLGSINRTFTVKVKARISKPRIHEPDSENVTVVQGMNATLTCVAWSLGETVFRWKRWSKIMNRFNSPRDLGVSQLLNKEHVFKSRSTAVDKNEFKAVLVIRNVTNEDEGKYKCVVKNKHGSDEMDIYLHVLPISHQGNVFANQSGIVRTTETGKLNLRTDEVTPVILVAGLTASIVVTLIFIIVLIVLCRKQRKQLEKQYVIEYKPEELIQHPLQESSTSHVLEKVVHHDVYCEYSTLEKPWKQQSCGHAVKTLKDVKEHLDSCFTSTKQTQCSQYDLHNPKDSEQASETRNASADGLNLNSRTSSQRTLSRQKSCSRELSSSVSNKNADRGSQELSREDSTYENVSRKSRDLRESIV